MYKEQKHTRRDFIFKCGGAGMAFLAGAWMLGGCKTASAIGQEKGPVVPEATEPLAQQAPPVQQAGPKPAEKPAGNPCDDLTGVAPGEIEKRKKLAYLSKSPIADNQCSNCSLYIPPAAGKPCGGCLLFKGPVRAEGYCTYWAPIS
jgi:hypothetical protein